MALLDWLLKRKKSISEMTRSELRRQELLIEKDRNVLLRRIQRLATEKQALFDKGAVEKTPEVRKALAQEFELKTTEQLMVSRQMNIRSKELLTVARLRLLRENNDRAQRSGNRLGLIGEKDLLKLGRLIENDGVTSEMYQERLDRVVQLGAEIDEGSAGLTDAGQTVLDVWNRMDQGVLTDRAEAFEEADRSVREQQAAPED